MGTLIKNGIDYTNDRTPNYSLLLNKPQINGVELVGNKTSKDLKLISEKNFQDVVADAYSDIANYVIGDYFLYDDKLYRVIANCQGIYPPNELYYEETTLTREQGGIRFGIDGDGNYGYYKGDDTFVPFKSGGGYDVILVGTNTASVNVSSYEGFQNFTADNFIVEVTNHIVGGWHNSQIAGTIGIVSVNAPITKNYNQTTGVFSVGRLNIQNNQYSPTNGAQHTSISANINGYKIYLLKPM